MSCEDFASERYGSNSEKFHYITSEDGCLKAVDPKRTEGSKLIVINHFFKSVFLPQGYPDSVSDDYLEYQLWDTLQAFCSSITGTLATQAVLKGYGVGDETATVAAATITWMLKDGMGMVGRILFAWNKGTQLDCDAKRWRLFADVLNDFAILLDLIAPIFKSYFVLIACVSSIARSIVGVAGGATRASLTLHQAKRDNMADVSAKDGSQETLVNLMALLAGFIITPLVTDNPILIWVLFFVFTFLHLFANYCAVCSVVMETLNLPRLHLLMVYYLKHNAILNPEQLSKFDPVLRSPGYSCSVKVGARFGTVIKRYEDLKYIADSETDTKMYVVAFDQARSTINIVLHEDASDSNIRRSCFHALLLDILMNKPEVKSTSMELQQYLQRLTVKPGSDYSFPWQYEELENTVKNIYPTFEEALQLNGWDMKTCHLRVDEWRTNWNKKFK